MDQIASTSKAVRKRRPGGRTAEVTRRINRAVLELLVEGGIEACSFQSVAARAGIERSTLYRRNPDRWPTIVNAIIDLAEREVMPFDTGSFRADLAGSLKQLTNVLMGPLGAPFLDIVAAVHGGAAPGEAHRFWESRRRQIEPMFNAAIARGELSADVDRDEVMAMAAGPIYFRVLITAQPVDDDWIAIITNAICDRFCIA